ncbi:hypothetical protein cyc_02809 [Cyclospora cayetanensis]|uniref:Uncharacterized protein n=1 Tax=Cyclospora cayetanensis TaxID=88456 RepID=A0A1D3DAX7_9EIME|nr:hypothetical protein cyc_02809 [Cyclospora cayetanensis]
MLALPIGGAYGPLLSSPSASSRFHCSLAIKRLILLMHAFFVVASVASDMKASELYKVGGNYAEPPNSSILLQQIYKDELKTENLKPSDGTSPKDLQEQKHAVQGQESALSGHLKGQSLNVDSLSSTLTTTTVSLPTTAAIEEGQEGNRGEGRSNAKVTKSTLRSDDSAHLPTSNPSEGNNIASSPAEDGPADGAIADPPLSPSVLFPPDSLGSESSFYPVISPYASQEHPIIWPGEVTLSGQGVPHWATTSSTITNNIAMQRAWASRSPRYVSENILATIPIPVSRSTVSFGTARSPAGYTGQQGRIYSRLPRTVWTASPSASTRWQTRSLENAEERS